jgi:hypothetical protein
MRSVGEMQGRKPAPMRRLSRASERELLERIDPDHQHLPLLRGTGHLVVGRVGQWRAIERWENNRLVVGYVYRRGHLSDAKLVLPAGVPVVFVTIAAAA